MEKQSKGFVIEFFGDESVGIFPQQWEISGDFEFEYETDFIEFKELIAQAFELCSDTPIHVESKEDRAKRIKQETAHME